MIIDIDPEKINFIQFPEFHKMGKRAPLLIDIHATGDWDEVLDRTCYWGARYENGRKLPTGMVPLSNYQFLSSLEDHFLRDVSWQETEWYNWVVAAAPSRYKTTNSISKRLSFLDQLYDDCISGKYSQDHSRDDLPLVNIGRNGRISIEDGRHRICVAKVAGLSQIPVQINAVHSDVSLKDIQFLKR